MHLLATMPGTIADGSSAVDLTQTPGDIVMLSSADTEISLLAAAQRRIRAQDPAAPRLRLAPTLRLGHNFSVDLYMEPAARGQCLLALRGRASGRNLSGPQYPAGAAVRRRQARPGAGGAIHRGDRCRLPAMELSCRGRARER